MKVFLDHFLTGGREKGFDKEEERGGSMGIPRGTKTLFCGCGLNCFHP